MGVMDPREVSKMSESSHLKQFRLMSQYNSLMNERIYQVVATLSMEERERDMGIFFRSIHGTLNHILLADRIWMSRFATCTTHKFSTLDNAKLIFEFESLKQILYSDFEELRHERMETDKSPVDPGTYPRNIINLSALY
jgi:uncharacterized damage-inducible protein DinB